MLRCLFSQIGKLAVNLPSATSLNAPQWAGVFASRPLINCAIALLVRQSGPRPLRRASVVRIPIVTKR